VAGEINDLAQVRVLFQNLNDPAPTIGIAGHQWVIEYQWRKVVGKDGANCLKP
jgi:hypothetical protein